MATPLLGGKRGSKSLANRCRRVLPAVNAKQQRRGLRRDSSHR
jgi:hypothetical protein